MLYCEKCQRFFAPDILNGCPECEEELRPIRENDPVLLVSADTLKADMIAPLLDDTGIPYAKEGELGVGFTMRAGTLLETYRFYVPYGAYAKAHDLLAETFGEDKQIMEALV